MGTAKQLIPTFVDAQPIVWNRDFVQNMRHIRGYPNWWRIRDDQSFIDGPPSEGEQYTKELFIWRAEIVKDASDENTDTLELYNLAEFLTVTEEVVNGETIYSYKYRDTLPALRYTHTDVIDSVSLEFDQSGRRMVAFESMGDVFLIWYDSQVGDTVVTNWGAGYNPQIVTDTYRRTGGSSDSERLLFYVDNTTKQIVYRKQLDRFGVVYTLPAAPQDIVELLKVSKNLYGGLTVLYCYDDGAGGLLTGSFTARDFVDGIHIGTDGFVKETYSLFQEKDGTIETFNIKQAKLFIEALELISPVSGNGLITDFILESKTVHLNTQTSEDSIIFVIDGTIGTFAIVDESDPVILLSDQQNSNTFIANTDGDIQSFVLKNSIIQIPQQTELAIELLISAGTVNTFTLG